MTKLKYSHLDGNQTNEKREYELKNMANTLHIIEQWNCYKFPVFEWVN